MDTFFAFALVMVCAAPIIGAAAAIVYHYRPAGGAHRARLITGRVGRIERARRSAQWRQEAHAWRASRPGR